MHHGYLGKYMHGKKHQPKVATSKKTPDEPKIDNWPNKGRVNMISWKASLGGASTKEDALKRYQSNNVISFFDDNIWRV